MHYSDLGYKHYQEYVDGPEWQEIKDYFFKHCGEYKCRICGRHWKLLLHKRSYEYLTMEKLRNRFIFKFFIVRYLKKYMTWLCFPDNDLVHFDDDGGRIELDYKKLWRREQQIYRRRNAWYNRLLRKRPSEIINLLSGR